MADRIKNLVNEAPEKLRPISRAEAFLKRYEQANQDRQFTYSMEELLVSHSTEHSDESLLAMEKGFRQILLNRGYDLDTLTPKDVASRLETDHTPIKLTDALELWLATRMKLDDIGSQKITTDEIQKWTEAMCVADSNRLRNAIRATIFRTAKPDKMQLDDAVAAGDLSMMCARKLSWLAQAYNQVGDAERAAEIRDYALALHSSDMMLNFEHAIRLMAQGRAERAIGYFMRCTSIRPRNSAVWKGLAEAQRQNGELQEAQKTIKIAIKLDPDDAGSHLSLSKWQLQDGHPKKATASAERALALDERVNTARRVIGRANMELGNYSKALIAFKEFQNGSSESESNSVREWIAECQNRIGSGH